MRRPSHRKCTHVQGYLIGSGVFGNVADAIGRKPALLASTALTVVFAFATLGAGPYWLFLLLRACTGVGIAGGA